MNRIKLLEDEIEISRIKINLYNKRIRRIKTCNKDDYRLEYYDKMITWEKAHFDILNNRLREIKKHN